MQPFLYLLLHFFFFSCQSTFSLSSSSPSPYDVLQSHGLPRGLLPRNIKSFSVAGDGRFEATLDAPCTANFESAVHYNSSISGTLSYGQIESVTGLLAQDLFLWFPVLRIRVDVPSSGIIYFDVGVVYKRFPLSLFETPPECTPDPSTSSTAGDSSQQHAVL